MQMYRQPWHRYAVPVREIVWSGLCGYPDPCVCGVCLTRIERNPYSPIPERAVREILPTTLCVQCALAYTASFLQNPNPSVRENTPNYDRYGFALDVALFASRVYYGLPYFAAAAFPMSDLDFNIGASRRAAVSHALAVLGPLQVLRRAAHEYTRDPTKSDPNHWKNYDHAS